MLKLQPKEVKVFTREDPCTKVHLHNCFFQNGAYVQRAVIEARGEIGVNAIKYLRSNGWAVLREVEGVDYWKLSKSGEQWLTQGLTRHLELHPEDAANVVAMQSKPKTRRVTRKR